MDNIRQEILKKLDDSLHLHELPRNKIFEIKDSTRINPLLDTPYVFNITIRLHNPIDIREVSLAPFIQVSQEEDPLQFKHDQITLGYQTVLQVRLKENTKKAQYMLGISPEEHMPVVYHNVFNKSIQLQYVTQSDVPALTQFTEGSITKYHNIFDIKLLYQSLSDDDIIDVPEFFHRECDSINELYYSFPDGLLKKLTSGCSDSSLPHITDSVLKESIKRRKEKEGRLYQVNFNDNFFKYLNNVSLGAEVFGGMGLFDTATGEKTSGSEEFHNTLKDLNEF